MKALWASLLAGLATGAGALPVVAVDVVPEGLQLFGAGLASGVMVFVAALGLLSPALETGPSGALAGLGLGAVGLAAIDVLLEHCLRRSHASALRSGFLLWLAVALHNIPEGVAVGAAYASSAPAWGLALAIAMAAHNVPEGLAVALPLRHAGVSPRRTLAVATSAGLVEPLAAAVAYLLVAARPGWLPAASAFAAGAMFYVVFAELLPLIGQHDKRRWGIAGLAAGMALAFAVELAVHASA